MKNIREQADNCTSLLTQVCGIHFEEINKIPVPYKWKYKMDTINLADEDVSQVIYEVVNAKAANRHNQGKRAPIPPQRKKKTKKPDDAVET